MTPNDLLGVDKLIAYKRDPRVMVRELFGVEPDNWQSQALEEFPHCNRQAFGACKGPGKTAFLAWIAWNFLLTRFPCKVGAVSITGTNLDDNLWPEMEKWRQKSPLLQHQFEWTSKSVFLKSRPNECFMSHKTWSKSANTEELGQTLAGFWSDHVLFLLDEAGGIPVPIMRTAEAALQGADTEGHLVIAGNCNSIEGCLYDAMVTNKALWITYHITGDPADPNRSKRINAVYAQEMIDRYGRDDPWVKINILAQFPSQGVNQLISLDLVNSCIGRHLHPHAYEYAPRILGVDVSGMGDDRTVIAPRQGLVYHSPIILRQLDSMFIAGTVMEKATTWGAHSVQIDNTGGYGAGVISICASEGRHVLPVEFAGKPLDARYFNKRAEMYWKFKENLELGASMPRDCPDMVGEITAVTYSYKGDRLLLEPKELLKARLGRSPDIGDAMACTHAFPVAATENARAALFPFDISAGVGKSKCDYDPLQRE